MADYTNADFNTAWDYSVAEFFAYMGAHIESERAKQKMMKDARNRNQ